MTPFYNVFNRAFGAVTNGYVSVTTLLVRKFVLSMLLRRRLRLT